MENPFKLKLHRIFRSCKTKKLTSDVVIHSNNNNNTNNDINNHLLFDELFSPKPRTLRSTARLRCPKTSRPEPQGQKCPPTPAYLPSYDRPEKYSCGSASTPKQHGKSKKKKRKKKQRPSRYIVGLLDDFHDISGAFMYNGLFSSDDGDDAGDMFFSSSRSLLLSSDSDSVEGSLRRRDSAAVNSSFAVVKRSSDPYGDFMASMLEMIVEKGIFGGRDLEKLLQCFLSLNSDHHHGIIIEAFSDICEALFSLSWSED
ncbi:unnamed protein product [Cuscuta europaea]|uniref:Transcription repressor n=1 Tax=Cuscuta europaea TaxID=41803 RepID=A0A9P1A0J1_CUSEU|nr:unnamed protein product [Cuscuta europaea]